MLEFADGLSLYGTDEAQPLLYGWSAFSNGSGVSGLGLNTSGGVDNRPYFRGAQGMVNTFPLSSAKDTVIIGKRCQSEGSLPATRTNIYWMEIQNSGGTALVTVTLHPDGSLKVRSGGTTGTIIAETDPAVIVPDVWYYVELKAFANTTSGTVELRINGVTEASATNVNTGAAGTYAIFRAGIPVGTGYPAQLWMDIYLNDDTGSYCNDFLGDTHVIEDVPDADGAENDFTPSSGGAAYADVDDIPQDGDTTYIEAANVNDRQTLTFPDLPAEYTQVHAIQLGHVSRKTTAGAGSMDISAISNGTEGGGRSDAISESYAGWTASWETDPDTGLPWAIARANAVTAALERTA